MSMFYLLGGWGLQLNPRVPANTFHCSEFRFLTFVMACLKFFARYRAVPYRVPLAISDIFAPCFGEFSFYLCILHYLSLFYYYECKDSGFTIIKQIFYQLFLQKNAFS